MSAAAAQVLLEAMAEAQRMRYPWLVPGASSTGAERTAAAVVPAAAAGAEGGGVREAPTAVGKKEAVAYAVAAKVTEAAAAATARVATRVAVPRAAARPVVARAAVERAVVAAERIQGDGVVDGVGWAVAREMARAVALGAATEAGTTAAVRAAVVRVAAEMVVARAAERVGMARAGERAEAMAAILATVRKVAMAWQEAVDGVQNLADRVETSAEGRAEGRGAVVMAGMGAVLEVEVAGAATRVVTRAEKAEAALEASMALETATVDVAVRGVILAARAVKEAVAVKVAPTVAMDLVVEARGAAEKVVVRRG